jgi:hypothetical protein
MESTNKYTAYKILPEFHLIVQYLRGPVEGDDAIHLVEAIRQDDSYSPKYNILIDFRDITINYPAKIKDSLSGFISYINENPGLMSGKRMSILFSQPIQAVLSTFLREDYSALSILTGLFSTLEAALKNLNIPQTDVHRIHEEIEKLK